MVVEEEATLEPVEEEEEDVVEAVITLLRQLSQTPQAHPRPPSPKPITRCLHVRLQRTMILRAATERCASSAQSPSSSIQLHHATTRPAISVVCV